MAGPRRAGQVRQSSRQSGKLWLLSVVLLTVFLGAAWQTEVSASSRSLALRSFPRVLAHFVVIRYRCFTQLSLKIQVYCEIEVSL